MFRSTCKTISVFLTLFVSIIGGGKAANAQIYGSGSDFLGAGQSRLYEILNFQTASPTVHVIGNMGVDVGDLAISDTGVIYAALTGVGTIRTVNATTGVLGPTVISGIGADINALAWGTGNLLYSYGFTSGVIKKIDLNTNNVTTLATLPDTGGDLALDPTDGSLYAVAMNSNLYKINPASGAFNLEGNLVLGGAGASIAVDYTGQMYALTATQSAPTLRYYSVNKANASSSLIADFTSVNVGSHGLGAAPVGPTAVPEPGSITLVAVMVSSMALLLRRRRKQSC